MSIKGDKVEEIKDQIMAALVDHDSNFGVCFE